MSLKGGYLICNLKGLDVNTSKTIDGIYDLLEGNYNKPILVSGIVIDSVEYKDCYCAMSVDGDNIVLQNASFKFTITDEDAVVGEVYDLDEISNKKIYFHPLTIYSPQNVTISEVEYNIIVSGLILNNDTTTFTNLKSIYDYAIPKFSRLNISGCIYDVTNSTLITTMQLYITTEHIYVIGMDSSGNRHDETNSPIDLYSVASNILTIDGVNAIN